MSCRFFFLFISFVITSSCLRNSIDFTGKWQFQTKSDNQISKFNGTIYYNENGKLNIHFRNDTLQPNFIIVNYNSQTNKIYDSMRLGNHGRQIVKGYIRNNKINFTIERSNFEFHKIINISGKALN